MANPLKRARDALSVVEGTRPEDFLVTSLPGLHENIAPDDVPLMFAGQLQLYKENNTHYFFWKFVDQHKAPEASNKTIFWLNGGPGCLSMDGALMEAGPLRVNDKKQVYYNAGLWHRKGDIVFVDQPAGTGFSYGSDYDHELGDVLWHFLRFLERYLAVFPADRHNDFVLAGESYAGQYIPYIADAIVARNARVPPEEHYHLKGLMIGNGYIDPNRQGLLFVPFAVQNGLITQQHPRFGELLKAHERCQTAVSAASVADTAQAYAVVNSKCDHVLTTLLAITRDDQGAKNQQCLNMYDFSLKDLYPSCGMNWPPDLEYVNPFLRDDTLMGNLNLIYRKAWSECSGKVSSNLRARNLLPAVKLLPQLLEHMAVVLFHGNRDIICNHVGAEDMIQHLKWNGATGFSADAPRYTWLHNDTVEGVVQSERSLTYVNVYNASHMVPFDKPEASRALVDLLYQNFEVRDGKMPAIVTEPMVRVTNSTSSAPSANTVSTNRAVRLIQLAVFLVIVWGAYALYLTYRSGPTLIIKTKPGTRRKNVQWADQMPDDKPKGLLAKAVSKLRRSDKGYMPVEEDIEMAEDNLDDFVIASDDEAETHSENTN